MGHMLIVTAQAPFPPRNGVTVPTAALSQGLLARGHRVEVAWLRGPTTDPQGEEETGRAVEKLHEVEAIPRSLPARIFGELALGRPAFDRWRLGSMDEPGMARPDLIWATPRSCVNPAIRIRARAGWDHVPVMAAVNDAWSGVLARRGSTRLAGALRRAAMARAERKLLAQADGVVVQSPEDARVLTETLGLPSHRVHVLANGADDRLFDLTLERARPAVGWVGDARNEHYGSGIRRFLSLAWPQVREAHPALTLQLSGPGTERLAQADDPSVVVRGFVPDLRDVYAPLCVLVAPVFKGHGRINKVVEAMAAGVPVVGDSSAFHGIEGFESGRHGVIVEGWGDFGRLVANLIADDGRLATIGEDARAFAQSSFRWADRVERVEHWLTEGP